MARLLHALLGFQAVIINSLMETEPFQNLLSCLLTQLRINLHVGPDVGVQLAIFFIDYSYFHYNFDFHIYLQSHLAGIKT